jgi:hypothetical protein
MRPSPVLCTRSPTLATVLIAARHAAPATCTPRDKQTRFSQWNKGKRKTKQNYAGFEFKPRQVNDSSQANQGTDHLVSQEVSSIVMFFSQDAKLSSWVAAELTMVVAVAELTAIVVAVAELTAVVVAVVELTAVVVVVTQVTAVVVVATHVAVVVVAMTQVATVVVAAT